MNLRCAARELARTHDLARGASLRLLALAVPVQEPTQVRPCLWRGVAVLALTASGILRLARRRIAVAANISIWPKEYVIAHGQPIFVPFAPADSHSRISGRLHASAL